MVRELRTRLREGDRVGVVDDEGVDVELLGGHLEFVAARPGHHHPMPGVAEAFRDRASQLRIAAGDQHLHRSDLLVFAIERLVYPATGIVAHRGSVPGIAAQGGIAKSDVTGR